MMKNHSLEFNARNLSGAAGNMDSNDPESGMPEAPRIAVCTMAPPTLTEYQLADVLEPPSWDISPASVLTVGVSVWAAATGGALYFALG